MGNIVLMFICQGGSVSVECDNLDNLDWVIAEMEKRGFKMWPGMLPVLDKPSDAATQSKFTPDDLSAKPVDFCPLHGSKKKWADTRDGGHYCGEKVNNKWCGYKEDEDGNMTKPPHTKPDYVQF